MFDMDAKTRKVLALQERRAREARRGRLGRQRFDGLVNEIAGSMRLAREAGMTASIFGLEGPIRAAIREDLCLSGWGWAAADLVALDLLRGAFLRLGAERPTWAEGQPEWTIEAGTLIERTQCIRCHNPLPEGHRKFCSELCGRAHRMRLRYLMQTREAELADKATRSI